MIAKSATADLGLQPPQQARSRAALQRLLASAEHVLVNEGPEAFTIARVAEHARVSVGGVYRRFANKEQLIEAVRHALLEQLEDAITEALDAQSSSLGDVVGAFTAALSRTLDKSGRIIPVILAGGLKVESPERGLQTIANLRQRFVDAASPFREEIRRPDPITSLDIAFRSVIAAGAHRIAISQWWPDGLTWQQWTCELTDMTIAYLTAEPQNGSAAT
jgi:AcrR family transcriptional regulator